MKRTYKTHEELDAELIEQASSLHYHDWSLIDKMILKAHSEETREKLNDIMLQLYRDEEYSVGLI